MHSSPICRLLLAVFLASPMLASAAETPRSPIETPGFSAVVATPDIKEPLTNAQLNTSMREAERVMRLDAAQVAARPQIVILQLSPSEAKRLGLTQTVLLSNKGKTVPQTFYEVWLVGPYATADLARGVAMVYEIHYGLKYNDKERGQMVKRIAGVLGSTVTVEALRSEKSEKNESGDNR
jgi:hypothetical protein